MKIVRFVSEEGHLLYGMYDPAKPGEARIIRGDIFGDHEALGKYIKIKEYLPPVDPCNILAVGLNYRKHADEIGMAYPENPVVFIKAASSVVGHLSPILLPVAGPDRVDYEAELAVIIGKKAKNISSSEVMDCIAGYVCSNDVSARDWQFERQNQQWARGKSFDTFCPLGPYLVTSDEIPNPNSLRIRTILNGNTLQDSDTSDMVFNIKALVSDLSRSMTLMPGTVVLTGTPEGVGFTRKPPVYLKDGDIITISIEHIGELTNPVKKEVLV
jgi:2-keto-4-pentenoate hydratase/2-oxohepta-3-ene-1,7-dioic acid hydratase in catechol pathway